MIAIGVSVARLGGEERWRSRPRILNREERDIYRGGGQGVMGCAPAPFSRSTSASVSAVLFAREHDVLLGELQGHC